MTKPLSVGDRVRVYESNFLAPRCGTVSALMGLCCEVELDDAQVFTPWQKQCRRLKKRAPAVKAEGGGERAELEEEAKYLKEENEVFGRTAEKYGDLSCCYSAEDVCRVVDRAFDTQREAATKALGDAVALLREARDWLQHGRDRTAAMDALIARIDAATR